MKVVVAHNRYQSSAPSGENRIVDSEIELLRKAGVEVIPFIEDSDELRGAPFAQVTAAAGPIVSPRGIQRLRSIIAEHDPDVLHLHNVFPLISPWSVRTAKAAGVAVVQTVHNYRHTCVAGMHLRDGQLCEDCRHHLVPWPAVRHACYRGSRGQSALMAVGQLAHRRTWRLVDRFLVASPLMQERLVSTGIDSRNIEWRPTFSGDAGSEVMPERGPVAFVGRLERAKGVELLLDAWTPEVASRWGSLALAGDGPLKDRVLERSARDPSVDWRGSLDAASVRVLMRESRLIALPSLWLEGFPRVAAEAMSVGRPLLLWEGAGFSRVAESGAAWALAADPRAWTRALLAVQDAELLVAAAAARRFYEQHCAPDVALEQLLRTYDQATRATADP